MRRCFIKFGLWPYYLTMRNWLCIAPILFSLAISAYALGIQKCETGWIGIGRFRLFYALNSNELAAGYVRGLRAFVKSMPGERVQLCYFRFGRLTNLDIKDIITTQHHGDLGMSREEGPDGIVFYTMAPLWMIVCFTVPIMLLLIRRKARRSGFPMLEHRQH
jgi:hypothetical protein